MIAILANAKNFKFLPTGLPRTLYNRNAIVPFSGQLKILARSA